MYINTVATSNGYLKILKKQQHAVVTGKRFWGETEQQE
jgi:hypothetical protein